MPGTFRFGGRIEGLRGTQERWKNDPGVVEVAASMCDFEHSALCMGSSIRAWLGRARSP
jgi:hypothetical protein